MDEEKKKAEGGGEAAPSGPETIVSGESGTIGGGAGSAGAQGPRQTGSGAATRSGSWTNLRSYIDANKGNDATMGQKVAGAGEQLGKKAETGGTTFKSTATKETVAGSTIDDSYTPVWAKTAPQPTAPAKPASGPAYEGKPKSQNTEATGSVIQGLKASPTTVSGDAFSKQVNAAYTGPSEASEVTGYEDTLKDYTAAGDFAKNANAGQAGRSAVLARNDVYGRDSYTRGERNLDSFILGGGDAGQAALKGVDDRLGEKSKLQTGWQSLLKEIGSVGDAKSMIGQGKALTDKTRDETRAAFGGATDKIEGRIGELETKAAGKNAEQTKLLEAIKKGDPKALQAAGYSPDEIAWIQKHKDLDLGGLIDQGAAFGIDDFATDEDRAGYNALLDLAGLSGGAVSGPAAHVFTGGGRGVSSNKGAGSKIDEIIALEGALGGRLDKATGDFNALKASIAAGATDPAARATVSKALKIDPKLLDQLYQYGIDPMEYVQNFGAPAMGSVVTPEEAAQIAALYDALGIGGADAFKSTGKGKGPSFNSKAAIGSLVGAKQQAALQPWRDDAAAKAAAAAAAANAKPAPKTIEQTQAETQAELDERAGVQAREKAHNDLLKVYGNAYEQYAAGARRNGDTPMSLEDFAAEQQRIGPNYG